MKITIRKIAEIAGVSRGTVDRVLNNRPGVKPDVREHILKIMSDLNFEPNKAAKALAHNKKPVVFGVVMPSREISFFIDICSGIEAVYEELKDFGIRIEYRYVSNMKLDETLLAIDELLEMGISGLMVSSMNEIPIREKINEVVDRNIPVVTFNSDITNCKRICFVGQDLYKSGQVAAGLMSRTLEEGSNVLALTGNMEFQAHKARTDGFAARLNELNKKINLVEVIEGYDRYEDTYEKVLEAFKKNMHIKGIYMATGDVQGCIDAVKKRNIPYKVSLICNDLLPGIIEYVNNGMIDFTITQNPFLRGYKPVKILFDYIFFGKTPENEHIFTEIEIKIAENI